MTLATLSLLALLMPSTPQPTRVDPDPLASYRWTHRLLVLDVPDSPAGRATLDAFRTVLDEQTEDVRDRDLLVVPVGDLPHGERPLQPAVDLGDAGRRAVRQRLGLQGQRAQLVLIGKDGGVKARQSGDRFDLAALLSLIDGMPMRRAETERR